MPGPVWGVPTLASWAPVQITGTQNQQKLPTAVIIIVVVVVVTLLVSVECIVIIFNFFNLYINFTRKRPICLAKNSLELTQ